MGRRGAGSRLPNSLINLFKMEEGYFGGGEEKGRGDILFGVGGGGKVF